ncbi:MAG: polysaccharide lyase family 7 protein [Limimaricola soesokkakensis]|uniref:polysaccharide lyase family 7 protein n=1 Tax=Limimaricola soesokkakensis TaxID=1343159 RepID=UPI0040580526
MTNITIGLRSGVTLLLAGALWPATQVAAQAPETCADISPLAIVSASDDGSFDAEYGPDRVFDNDFDPDSRWSSEGAGKQLTLDLGEAQALREVGLAFYKGDERRTSFDLEASEDGESWTSLISGGQSTGQSTAIERFEVPETPARYLRLTGQGNEASGWNSLIEVQAYGCGSGEVAELSDGSDTARVANMSKTGLDLRIDVPPSENFDLTGWKLTLPADLDQDGKVDEISENELQGWSDDRFFYTDPVTGGMVFRTVPGGFTTSGSSYARSELREMIRRGDESISTRNDDGTPTANNWVFSSAPEEAQAMAGGVDGVMRATLAVNQVTRIGEAGKVGRVIIGQIHAKDDEPIRLYYRKLPGNKFGSIYFAHEAVGEDDVYVEMIGSRGNHAENPDDGIALDETFAYEIAVRGEERDGVVHPMLHVAITRDDGSRVEAEPYDMSESGYSVADDFMYFKAGAYSQNNTSDRPDRDFDQVTFFELDVEHGS